MLRHLQVNGCYDGNVFVPQTKGSEKQEESKMEDEDEPEKEKKKEKRTEAFAAFVNVIFFLTMAGLLLWFEGD